MGQDRGAAQHPAQPCHGTWHQDSPESDDTVAAGPGEDKGVGGLAFLLLGGIPSCTLPTAQHLQLAQNQAVLWAWGTATSA